MRKWTTCCAGRRTREIDRRAPLAGQITSLPLSGARRGLRRSGAGLLFNIKSCREAAQWT